MTEFPNSEKNRFLLLILDMVLAIHSEIKDSLGIKTLDGAKNFGEFLMS